MCTKVTLCIGLNDKDTKHQEITTAAAKNIINAAVIRFFGFGTITETTGIYTHDDGTNEIVTEATIKIELSFFDTTKAAAVELVRPFAVEMKTALNQESIYSDFVECEAILF